MLFLSSSPSSKATGYMTLTGSGQEIVYIGSNITVASDGGVWLHVSTLEFNFTTVEAWISYPTNFSDSDSLDRRQINYTMVSHFHKASMSRFFLFSLDFVGIEPSGTEGVFLMCSIPILVYKPE